MQPSNAKTESAQHLSVSDDHKTPLLIRHSDFETSLLAQRNSDFDRKSHSAQAVEAASLNRFADSIAPAAFALSKMPEDVSSSSSESENSNTAGAAQDCRTTRAAEHGRFVVLAQVLSNWPNHTEVSNGPSGCSRAAFKNCHLVSTFNGRPGMCQSDDYCSNDGRL